MMFYSNSDMFCSGVKSASGYPIMSSDPHLDVSKTPNTFYESAYKSPGGVSVFGITVPGRNVIKTL